MRSEKLSARVSNFFDGLRLALASDGQIGTNDVSGLRQLATKTRLASAERLVDQFQRVATEPPLLPRGRMRGTGYAVRVVDFAPGPGAGFNADHLEAVLGRPEGAGLSMGSLDVVSLGVGGSITLELGRAVTRGLVVFENAFQTADGDTFREPAQVEVSPDGQQWFTLQGSAGNEPVLANRLNGIRARSPEAGGDRFLFADSDIPDGTAIRFVRITDLGQGLAVPPTAGFDLDAVYGF